MSPEQIFPVAILGCVVLILGAFLGAFILGRSSQQPKIEALEDEVADERASRKAAQKRAAHWAKRAKGEADGLVANASAVASGDLDRVRLGFPDDGTGAPAGEPGDSPEPTGG